MGRFHGMLLAEEVGGTALRSGSLLAQELSSEVATKIARREKCFIIVKKKARQQRGDRAVFREITEQQERQG